MWTLLILAALNTDCYVLSSADQRAFCLAREHGVSHCYSISDRELRAQCRAEVQRDASICDQLMGDARQICKSRATN